MRILGTAKTDLGDVDCVMTVCLAQHHRCACGEHLPCPRIRMEGRVSVRLGTLARWLR